MEQYKEIQVLDRFNTSWGLIFAVRVDCVYRVGQIVESDGIRYVITGIHMSGKPDSDSVGLRVERISNDERQNI